MSRISAKTNLDTRDWDIEYYDYDPINFDILMGFHRGGEPGDNVPFYGLMYGFEIMKDGESEPFYEETYPPEGSKYISTDQEYMQRSKVILEKDTQYKITFWVSDKGDTQATEFEFISPDAIVHYPSFVWDGEMWRAPIDYPDDGKMYIWNELERNWVLLNDDADIDEVSNATAKDPLKPNETADFVEQPEVNVEGSHWQDLEATGWQDLSVVQNLGSNPDAN